MSVAAVTRLGPPSGTLVRRGAFIPCVRTVSTRVCHLSSRQPAWSGETSLAELWTQAVSGW